MEDRFEDQMNNLIPMVVEQSNRGERAYERTHYFFGWSG